MSAHYRLSARAAATAVNASAQTRVGRRDVSDDRLMPDIFSGNVPKPGQTACGVPVTQPIRPSRAPARHVSFALGCFSCLRNPASREQEEWLEQIALECLAAFSIVARRISGWELAAGAGREPHSQRLASGR
jgi:hypothetical protein